MINIHERMLPNVAGIKPVTFWSPVGCIHQGQQVCFVATTWHKYQEKIQTDHYENTPIQIHWKFYNHKQKIFR